LKQKLLTTLVVVLTIVAAAVLSDFLINGVLLATPGAFTPISTAIIAALVGAPVTYFLISQRLDLLRVKEALAATVADRERAVDEGLQRRGEAEAALERSRESEALYRLLADNQSDVISLWDADGRRLYASPSVERAFGYTVGEILTLARTANAHPDDLRIIRQATEGLVPGGDARTAEYRLIHKDGSEVWVEASFRRLGDGSGGLLTTARIISERKRLEGELIRALDDAKAALAVKSDFLANMTHELRTPLNAIIGFSGLLKQSPNLDAADARQVRLVWDASQTLLSVVNDVLDFSKLEASAVEFEAHPFDPAELAETTVSLLSGQAAQKGLTLSASADGPGGLLLGDGPRLRQVLINFISNAVKFTPRGDVRVLVHQTPEGDARRLRVAVQDSGIGVPPEQIDSIFARFTQGDASISRRYGGTGLGLAISKRIIDALGGQIGVTSEPGAGSTFWFEVVMPLAGRADAGAGVGATPADVASSLRLLVVDDNAINRELICTLLQPFDLRIDTAADGVEAVEAASRADYDLILMDVQMPNMDGLTATARIRGGKGSTARRVPIIAMTANVLPEQIERCLAAGMDDHLGKPISPAKLLEALARWSQPDEDDDAERPAKTSVA